MAVDSFTEKAAPGIVIQVTGWEGATPRKLGAFNNPVSKIMKTLPSYQEHRQELATFGGVASFKTG
jgi:hypothetical protein